MEAALEDDDIRPSCSMPRQFHGAFDRLRSRIAEEESVERRMHDCAQLADQCQQWLVDDNIYLAVDQQTRLFADGFHNPGVAMAGVGDSDPAREIQVGNTTL